jgi:hypothetical protein
MQFSSPPPRPLTHLEMGATRTQKEAIRRYQTPEELGKKCSRA